MPQTKKQLPSKPLSAIKATENALYLEKCYESGVRFQELTAEESGEGEMINCLRLYGSHANVDIQLRGLSSLSRRPGGKKRRMIATMGLNKAEVEALIERLTEILPTMYDSTKR